jgi:hypothetical protein
MEDKKQIILLDLNYTLVGNSVENKYTRPWKKKIEDEKYREWLVDLIRDEYVILITARPEYQKLVTMDTIAQKLRGWRPEEAYFNELDQYPPACKERILKEYIFPKHGEDAQYFAIESNPSTKRMYTKHNIPSVSIKDEEKDAEFLKAILKDPELQQGPLTQIKTPSKVKKSKIDEKQESLFP